MARFLGNSNLLILFSQDGRSFLTAPEAAEAQIEGKRIDNLHLSNIFGSEAKWPYLVSTPFPHCSRERKICTSVLAKTWALREVAAFGVAFQAQSLKN